MRTKIKNTNFFKNNSQSSQPQTPALQNPASQTPKSPVESNESTFTKNNSSQLAEQRVEIKQKSLSENSHEVVTPQENKPKVEKVIIDQAPLQLSQEIINKIEKSAELVKNCGFGDISQKILDLKNEAVRERFSVAVVGEFSRGKSSFINRLLGKEYLPVGDLPTTAMLTRIRYNGEEKLIFFDENGKKKAVTPISMKIWQKISDDNLNQQKSKGSVLMGVTDDWLLYNNIEIMDTPGAGDLEEARARMIGDALQMCDGAIITISATNALSISEKLFIESRLLTRKIPFLMLILTKLDQIRPKERPILLKVVLDKLKLWNLDVPVFIPDASIIPESFDKSHAGIDNIKNHILSWINDPNRRELTETWLINKAIMLVNSVQEFLKEQKYLAEKTEEERSKIAEQKKQQLLEASLFWEDLRIKMFKNFDRTFDALKKKIEKSADDIIEKLLYELSHSNSPQKWLNNDYPYRLKKELAAVASSVERGASFFIAEDAKWFNAELARHFKTQVSYKNQSIASEDIYRPNIEQNENLVEDDIDKKRNEMRIKTAAITIASYALLSATGLGGLGIMATLGVGTGAAIFQEKMFKGEVEKQKEEISTFIKINVPEVLQKAMEQSEKRLRAIYEDIINSSSEQEKLWTAQQKKIVASNLDNMKADTSYLQYLPKVETLLKELRIEI